MSDSQSSRPAVPLVDNQCPICARWATPSKPLFLYGALICRKCHEAFSWRRYIAFFADLLILMMLFKLSGKYLDPILSKVFGFSNPDMFIFSPLLLCFKDGFTGMSPGKWICGVRVVDIVSRQPIGLVQSFKRNLLLALPVGVLFMLIFAYDIHTNGRHWGDRWAKTMVIWRKHAHKLPFDPRGIYCFECDYNLTGNVSGICPECGTPVSERTKQIIESIST